MQHEKGEEIPDISWRRQTGAATGGGILSLGEVTSRTTNDIFAEKGIRKGDAPVGAKN